MSGTVTLLTDAASFVGPALAARLRAGGGSLTMVDIYSLSLIVLHWTVVFTVGLSAFIVMVMKGPGYVADPYPLSDADRPAVARPDTLPPGQG